MKELNNEILFKKENRIAFISLNRPPANSYYYSFLKNLASLLQTASEDENTKVICINSTSEKFFCAGADIKIFSSNTAQENKLMVLAAREVCQTITDSPKIVVVAIKGHILGGGLELAMACDIRIASTGNYLIGLPEVKLGLMPGNGGTPRLLDLIGVSRATELLVTGDSISPQKAYDFGLFNQLYPQEEFDKKLITYLKILSEGAGKAMATVKKYVQLHKGMNLNEGLEQETKAVDSLYATPDAKEGFLAFVEKRKPHYE